VTKKKSVKKKAVRLVRNGGTDVQPESEITASATRRTFTAEYKRDILRQAAECAKSGDVGALLRREGLYSSHLTTWRQARDRGELAGLRGQRRGPKGRKKMVPVQEAERLEREVARLKVELRKAQTIIGVQKKLSEMLGIEMKPDGSGE
jgi:transposase-like protein